MGGHGSRKRVVTIPPAPPAPPPAPLRSHGLMELHTAATALLDVLHRMPWVRDHRPDCPASSAGPCTCGVEHLVAALGAVAEALEP